MSSRIKRSILKLKESSTLVINEKSKELINQGKKVYQFGFGQSPFPIPEKIVEELKTLILLEAAELVKEIEEVFGVDTSVSVGAVAMAAPVAAADAGGAAGGDGHRPRVDQGQPGRGRPPLQARE